MCSQIIERSIDPCAIDILARSEVSRNVHLRSATMPIYPSISDTLHRVTRPVKRKHFAKLVDKQCAICRETCDSPVRVLCPSKHIFCRSCISSAFTVSDLCPCCRARLLDPLRDFSFDLEPDADLFARSWLSACLDHVFVLMAQMRVYGNRSGSLSPENPWQMASVSLTPVWVAGCVMLGTCLTRYPTGRGARLHHSTKILSRVLQSTNSLALVVAFVFSLCIFGITVGGYGIPEKLSWILFEYFEFGSLSEVLQLACWALHLHVVMNSVDKLLRLVSQMDIEEN